MVGGWKKAPQLWLAGSHYITCTLWLQNVFLTSPDKWPGQIWWANTPLIISGPAISGESGSLAQKVMCCHGILLTLNIRVIIAREVWYNQKQVRLSPELSSWYLNVSLLNWWEEAERQVRNKYGATTLCAVADKSAPGWRGRREVPQDNLRFWQTSNYLYSY